MEWLDAGFVLGARRHGENGLIVELLTRDHGRHAGLVRGGQSPRRRALLQPGNLVAAGWRGRLPEHLGTLECELLEPHASALLDDADRLAALSSAVALLLAAVAEREPQSELFASFAGLLDALTPTHPRGYGIGRPTPSMGEGLGGGDASARPSPTAYERLYHPLPIPPPSRGSASECNGPSLAGGGGVGWGLSLPNEPADSPERWPQAYIVWELQLLAALGFGLDLSRCAVTGLRNDLVYVSPRTGRAVSRDAGRPYHDKLLTLPAFLLGETSASAGDIVAGLNLTRHFLLHHVLAPQGARLPPARDRLAERMRRLTGSSMTPAS